MTSPTQTITVLFTDIVGSTELLSALGEARFDQVRRDHFEVVRGVLSQRNGTEVKNTGDGFMAVFSSAPQAAQCAAELVVVARRVTGAGRPVRIRVGVASGEATLDDGDWFGTPVVTAARLCAVAEPDQALVSDVTRSLSADTPALQFTALGERSLKGLPRSVAVHAVVSAAPRRTMYAEVDRNAPAQPGIVPMLDYWASLPAIEQLRTDLATAVAVLPGQTVVDVGCGTGSELVRYADLVGPTGRVIGVDPSEVMIDRARERTAGVPSAVDLVVADGRATGLSDASCDVVRIERVIQHTGDLPAFLAEAMRITRPGGWVAVVDTDWGSLMIHPGNRQIIERLKAGYEHGPMAEPLAGRMLHAGLVTAGLQHVWSEPYVVRAGPGLVEATSFITDRMVSAGLATQAEMDEHRADLLRAERDGSLYFAFVMVAAAGQRP